MTQLATLTCGLIATLALSFLTPVRAEDPDLGDVHLYCEGSITIYPKYGQGTTSVKNQEIFAHIMHNLIYFYGNIYLGGNGIRICQRLTDKVYFDS